MASGGWLIWTQNNKVYGPFSAQQVTGFLQAGGWKGPYPTKAAALRAAGQKPVNPKHHGKKGSTTGAEVVAMARTWLGVPYLFGGTTKSGVDCSGLVMRVAEALGVSNIPRTSEAQWAWIPHIPEHEAGTGDIVFFVGAPVDPPPGHEGIIVTPGTMINAPFTGTVVRYDHYANGSGSARIIGYGRLPGIKGSKNPNPFTGPGTTVGGGSTVTQGGAEVATAAAGMIVWIGVIILIAIGLLLLISAGVIFS